MMIFDENGGRFYMMNTQLEMFQVEMPYEVARERWLNFSSEKSFSHEILIDWMSRNFLIFVPLIAKRIHYSRRSDYRDDDRVGVVEIPKSSVLYKAALADRKAILIGRSEDACGPLFVPCMNFIFDVDETIYLTGGTDPRSEKGPGHYVIKSLL